MNIQEHTYERGKRLYITLDYYQFLEHNNLIIDGNQGGLLVGPLNTITGVSFDQNNKPFIAGQVKPGTFLVNEYAAHNYKDQLAIVVSSEPDDNDSFFSTYRPPVDSQFIEVVPRQIDGVLYTPVVFFSTKYMVTIPSTKVRSNLDLLERINRQAWNEHEETGIVS